MNTTSFSQSSTLRALLVAAGLIGVALALKWVSPDVISADAASRVLGVVMGGLVMLYANVAPKALTPLARMRCDPATEQSIRRFSGWSLTLGGLGFAVAWILAPMTSVTWIAASVLGLSLLLVLVRYVWATAFRSPS